MSECAQCKEDREYREAQEWERQLGARNRADEDNQARKAIEYCRMAGICQ